METESSPTTDQPKPRWFHLAPDRCVVGLLILEGLLLLSERLQWFAFNQQKGWTVLITTASVAAGLLLLLLWFVVSLLFHWRFQYSIRSLLLLVLVVAVPCKWLATEMQATNRQKEVVDAIERLGWEVVFDYQMSGGRSEHAEEAHALGQGFLWNITGPVDDQPHGLTWLARLVGVDCYANVGSVRLDKTNATDAVLENFDGFLRLRALNLADTKVTNAGLAHLKDLTELRVLSLSRTKISDIGLANLGGLSQLEVLLLDDTEISDAGLVYLKGLRRLRVLLLDNTNVSDAGLVHLQGLNQLQDLRLDGTRVTDAGLVRLQGLSRLHELWLDNTSLTDAGLVHLQGLKQLAFLVCLNNTKVTDQGVKKLHQALPKCEILYGHRGQMWSGPKAGK
jgi:hypothetical protein